MIHDACLGKDGGSPAQFHPLLVQFAQQIQQRPIVETRHTELVDEVLVGMMSIVCTIVKHQPEYREEVGQQYGLVQELYHNGLFALKSGNILDKY